MSQLTTANPTPLPVAPQPQETLHQSGSGIAQEALIAEQAWRAIEEGQRNLSIQDRTPLPEGKIRDLNQALANILQQMGRSEVVAVNDTFNVSTLQALRLVDSHLNLQSNSGNLSFQDYQKIIEAGRIQSTSAQPVEPSSSSVISQQPRQDTDRPANPDLDPVARFEKVQRGQEVIRPGDQSYALHRIVPLLNSLTDRGLLSGPPLEVPNDRRYTAEIESRVAEFRRSFSVDSSGRLQQLASSRSSSPSTLIDSELAYTLALAAGEGAIPAQEYTQLQAARSVFTQFRQYDGPWANRSYGGSGTISSSGCAPTSVATVLGMNGIETDPQQMADLAARNGFRVPGSGTSWGFFEFAADRYGLNYSNIGANLSAIDAQLARGRPVIVSVEGLPFAGGGHITVVYGKDANGNYLLADPGPRQVNVASPATLRNCLANAWTIYNQDRPGIAWRPESRAG